MYSGNVYGTSVARSLDIRMMITNRYDERGTVIVQRQTFSMKPYRFRCATCVDLHMVRTIRCVTQGPEFAVEFALLRHDYPIVHLGAKNCGSFIAEGVSTGIDFG